MQVADKNRFLAVMQYLSLNFPDRTVSGELVSFYFSDLQEFNVDDLEKAARTYVRTGDRFPLVSDFIRILS